MSDGLALLRFLGHLLFLDLGSDLTTTKRFVASYISSQRRYRRGQIKAALVGQTARLAATAITEFPIVRRDNNHAVRYCPPQIGTDSPGDGVYETIDSAIWWLLTSKIIVSRIGRL